MSLYAPPPEITAEIFTRLPDEFRKPVRTEWARWNRNDRPVDSFLEGPCFDAVGNLWVTDIPYGRIFRISPEGIWTLVAQYDGWPNGMKVHRDGRVFIADHRHGLLALDAENGAVTTLLDNYRSESFLGINDLTFAANGDLYFTDQGQTGLHNPRGRVFRLSARGELTCLIDNVPSPNGLVLNPAEDQLMLAVTRANAIWRLPLMADGGVSKVGLFIQLSGGVGPDGIAMDESGGLAVAHLGIGVWLFDADGVPRLRIRSPAGHYVTNMAHGGSGRRTLYMTESETGSILRAQVPAAGRHPFAKD